MSAIRKGAEEKCDEKCPHNAEKCDFNVEMQNVSDIERVPEVIGAEKHPSLIIGQIKSLKTESNIKSEVIEMDRSNSENLNPIKQESVSKSLEVTADNFAIKIYQKFINIDGDKVSMKIVI